MKIRDLFEAKLPGAWNRNPQIGWWMDNDPIRLYHGTHERNLDSIIKNGISAPSSGPTAGWVSLAIEPNTAHGYASMSGMGGESEFRVANGNAKHTPENERIVLVLEIPKDYLISHMAPARGNVDEYRDRLTNKTKYLEWKAAGKTDKEYYAIAEIRLPKHVPAKYIVGYMKKSGS